MFTSGLVSVSFRNLDCDRIIAATVENGIAGIEWGGDIHVPHGNLAQAAVVREKCAAANIAVSAYGSYYHAGESEQNGLKFADVLATAAELGAPLIRVWAGSKGSAQATLNERRAIAADLHRIAEMAWRSGIAVATEYHSGTLTDNNDSAYQLLFKEAVHPALLTFWQPPSGMPAEYCLAGLTQLLPKLASVHVFYWDFSTGQRLALPLADGEAVWSRYLELADHSPGLHCATLEFFKDDSLEQYRIDADTLKTWLSRLPR